MREVTDSSASGPNRPVTVADLLTVLAPAGLRLVSQATGRGMPLSRPALFDPLSTLPSLPGGLLLGVGLDPRPDGRLPEALDALRQAAQQGFRVLIVRAHGADPAPLAAAADDAGVALLVVDDDVDWRQLDSLITAALTTASHVGRSMSTLAVGDLFALANAVAAMVGGATAIEDPQQRVLAYSTLPDQPIDEDRRQGILGRQVPELPENAEQYREIFRSGRVCQFAATPPAMSRLAVAVRAGAELLGSIWVVDAHGDLGAEARAGLAGAAEIAALHLLRARSSQDLARQQHGELLRALLENHGDPDLVVDRLGLIASGGYVVLAFRPRLDSGRTDELLTTRLVDLVALHCEARQGRTACLLLGGTVYALLNGSGGRLESLAAEVVARARASLRTSLLAAVGTPVNHSHDIVTSRRNADLVLRLLTDRPRLGPVAAAADLRSSLVLLEIAQLLGDEPRALSPKSARLREHDARRGTRYAETLLCYLDAMHDIAAASTAMSVHPNTMRYRLRRCVELFDLDLHDPDEVLTLWLSLRVSGRR